MPSALIICDTRWSTGNNARGLIATQPDWHIDLHDWSAPYDIDDAPHDAVLCFTMTGPARNPVLATRRIANVCFGPGEMDLPIVQRLAMPDNSVLAGCNNECVELLRAAYPTADVHLTVGFANPTVFVRRVRTGPIRRAGFVGNSTAQNMEVSGHVKRPGMFRVICARAGLEAVFTEQNYRTEDMQQFYDSVDVIISTSSREGGPTGPFEAIACGVPVLSTDVGLVHDLQLPGRFDTVEQAVDMVPHVHTLVATQHEIAEQSKTEAIKAWADFLVAAQVARAGS